jgi:hypothetical protein
VRAAATTKPAEDQAIVRWCERHYHLRIFQKRKSMALTPPAPDVMAEPAAERSSLELIDHKIPAARSSTTNRHLCTPSYVTNQVQETVDNNRLSKYVLRDSSNLLHELGWEQVVCLRRQRGDFGNLHISHPAQCFLRHLRSRGVPVVLTTTPWDDARIHAAATRGPHKSARDHRAFLHT